MSSDPARARTGQGNAGKAIPQRFLGARPAQSQGGGQSGRAVAETLRALRRALHLEPLEEGPAQPRVDEPLDVPRGLELIGHVLVGAAPACPFGRVLNACGDPDEDGMAQWQIGADPDVQCHPGTERIAEKGTRLVRNLCPHRLRHQARCRREVGAHRTGISVSRQIHRDQGVRLGHEVPERSPEPPGLGEAVQQDQRRPGAAHLDVEWHVG